MIQFDITNRFVENMWKFFWFLLWTLFIICCFHGCYLADKYAYESKMKELEIHYLKELKRLDCSHNMYKEN